jgi:hypothetical protein
MTHKTIITGLVAALTSTVSYAQAPLHSNAHIGLAYPLSTNGVHAPEYSNLFSIHAIAGVSRSEQAFCASGVASIVKDSVNGLVASGVVNVIGGTTNGCQAAGFVNVAGGYVKGAQVAGFTNIAPGVAGAQVGGFANIALHSVNGAQVAGFVSTADTAHAQVSGFVNVAREARTQVAGFVNIAENVKGPQIAGFVNIAENVKGTQVAGFINIARKVQGVQLAGFINIADSSDCPIGLINIVGNGEQAIGLTMNETGTMIAAFRSGGRTLYGIIGVGGNYTGGYAAYAFQAGLGMHIPVSRTFRINAEASVTSLSDRWYHTDIRSGFRVMPALRFGNLELFAGPSFSYTASSDLQGVGRVGYSVWSDDSYYYSHDLSIGFEGGIQYHFNTKKVLNRIISENRQ